VSNHSLDWYKRRRGHITASRFGDVLAKQGTKRHDGYIRDLVYELGTGPSWEDMVDVAPWYEHGIAGEAEAIGSYEFQTDRTVDDGGFIEHATLKHIGCSPDGLVGEDGGCEAKCRASLPQQLTCERVGMPAGHKPQVQGCLWVTGRQWWDYLSYYVGDKTKARLHVHRVLPDLEYHARLEAACAEFWAEVQSKLESKPWRKGDELRFR